MISSVTSLFRFSKLVEVDLGFLQAHGKNVQVESSKCYIVIILSF